MKTFMRLHSFIKDYGDEENKNKYINEYVNKHQLKLVFPFSKNPNLSKFYSLNQIMPNCTLTIPLYSKIKSISNSIDYKNLLSEHQQTLESIDYRAVGKDHPFKLVFSKEMEVPLNQEKEFLDRVRFFFGPEVGISELDVLEHLLQIEKENFPKLVRPSFRDTQSIKHSTNCENSMPNSPYELWNRAMEHYCGSAVYLSSNDQKELKLVGCINDQGVDFLNPETNAWIDNQLIAHALHHE